MTLKQMAFIKTVAYFAIAFASFGALVIIDKFVTLEVLAGILLVGTLGVMFYLLYNITLQKLKDQGDK